VAEVFMKFDLETATTALCIWEELLNRYSNESIDAYSRKRDAVGACQMRELVVLKLAPAIELAWETVGEEYTESFDWEFIPEFLTHAEPILSQVNNTDCWNIPDDVAIQIARKIISEGVADGSDR
jgi:hypothetical protein